MTIDIENPQGVDLYFRIGDLGKWTEIPRGTKSLPASQRCEISLDAISSLGAIVSRNLGKGGTWSRSEDPIMPDDRKPVAQGVYLRGK